MFPRRLVWRRFLCSQYSFNWALLTILSANSPEIEKAREEWRFTSIFALNSMKLLISYGYISEASTMPEVLLSLLAFTHLDDTWNSKPAYEVSKDALDHQSQEVHTGTFIVDYVLKGFIRPLFAKSTPQTITSQGRKAPIENLGNRIIEVASSPDAISKPWKCRDIHAVTVFKWVVTTADVRSQVVEHHQDTN